LTGRKGKEPGEPGAVIECDKANQPSAMPAHSLFGLVVMMAKLRTHSPDGDRQFSHRPAKAISPRSANAIA
jgi:hypothetical protein